MDTLPCSVQHSPPPLTPLATLRRRNATPRRRNTTPPPLQPASQQQQLAGQQQQQPPADPKLSPTCDPSKTRDYPLRRWCTDVRNWVDYSTILVHQQCPLIRAVLQSIAEVMMEGVEPEVVEIGGPFELGNVHVVAMRTSFEVMLRILESYLQEFDIGTQLYAHDALNDVGRLPGPRYELICNQTYERAGLGTPPGVLPRRSFRIFSIPMTMQLRLLDGAYDNLPANPQQLADLQADIRRSSRWIRFGVSGTGIQFTRVCVQAWTRHWLQSQHHIRRCLPSTTTSRVRLPRSKLAFKPQLRCSRAMARDRLSL